MILGYDPSTLREKVDEAAVAARLGELGDERSASALDERAGLLRMSGRLDEALEVANEAVRNARGGGDREQILRARVRRAQVLQAQGKVDAAITEFDDCVTEAAAHGWAQTEADALQYRGTARFDQHDYPAAGRDFRDALIIRVRIQSPPELIDASMIAIMIADSFADSGES